MEHVPTTESNTVATFKNPTWKQGSAEVTAKPVCTSCARQYIKASFTPYLHNRLCTVERCENLAAFLYII